MVADLTAVGAGLVAQWLRVDGIKYATTNTDETLPDMPAILVYQPTLTLMERPPSQEYWEFIWPCTLIMEMPAGEGEATLKINQMVADCLQTFWNGYGLGLDYVVDCWIQGGRPLDRTAGEGVLPAYQFDVVTRLHWAVTRNKTLV